MMNGIMPVNSMDNDALAVSVEEGGGGCIIEDANKITNITVDNSKVASPTADVGSSLFYHQHHDDQDVYNNAPINTIIDSSPSLPHDHYEKMCCFTIYAVGVMLEFLQIQPTQRAIPYQYLENTNEYIRNLNYNETVAIKETVPIWLLIFLSSVLPIFIQLSIAKKLMGTNYPRDIHNTICVYLTVGGITLLLTESIKIYAGYLRPIFYQICEPDDNYEQCTNYSNNARKSFPSGHASSAFSGLTVFSLYLHNRFGLPSILGRYYYQQNNQHHVQRHGQVLQPILLPPSSPSSSSSSSSSQSSPLVSMKSISKHRFISILCFCPMAIAIFIAASRVVDNKHHPADVITGAVIGTSVATLINGLWFF